MSLKVVEGKIISSFSRTCFQMIFLAFFYRLQSSELALISIYILLHQILFHLDQIEYLLHLSVEQHLWIYMQYVMYKIKMSF